MYVSPTRRLTRASLTSRRPAGAKGTAAVTDVMAWQLAPRRRRPVPLIWTWHLPPGFFDAPSLSLTRHPPPARTYVLYSNPRPSLQRLASRTTLTSSPFALALPTAGLSLLHSHTLTLLSHPSLCDGMSAVAPRVAGTARRLSQSPGPAGSGREKPERDVSLSQPASRQETGDDKAAKKRLPAGVPSLLLRRQELLLRRGGGRTKGTAHHPRPPSSLTASFASEASTDSFCSRASTGRIGRPAGPPAARRRAAGSAGPPAARPTTIRKAAGGPGAVTAAVPLIGSVNGGAQSPAARCPWVTPNTGR
jgi:hypothetical protein